MENKMRTGQLTYQERKEYSVIVDNPNSLTLPLIKRRLKTVGVEYVRRENVICVKPNDKEKANQIINQSYNIGKLRVPVWKCNKCGNTSDYKESICEKCYGEDA